MKLADFGHSKVVDDIFVRSFSHVGTPLYMAPEAFSLEVGMGERGKCAWGWGMGNGWYRSGEPMLINGLMESNT